MQRMGLLFVYKEWKDSNAEGGAAAVRQLPLNDVLFDCHLNFLISSVDGIHIDCAVAWRNSLNLAFVVDCRDIPVTGLVAQLR